MADLITTLNGWQWSGDLYLPEGDDEKDGLCILEAFGYRRPGGAWSWDVRLDVVSIPISTTSHIIDIPGNCTEDEFDKIANEFAIYPDPRPVAGVEASSDTAPHTRRTPGMTARIAPEAQNRA